MVKLSCCDIPDTVNVYGKLESQNPAGSVKDRVAMYMIKDAIDRELIKPGSTIIEPTSGNTGIGLASIGIKQGFNVILTMPESMSIERRNLLSAYGAKIELTPATSGMRGAIDKANELCSQIDGSIILGQFDNPANPLAHEQTTGPEIFKQTSGDIDIFIAGVGTGGTITGVGRYLKSKKPGVKIIAVEPDASPMLSEGKAGPHGIQGIGAGFIPPVLDTKIYDEVITVNEQQAYASCRELAKKQGVLVGISSGAAAYAASLVAKRSDSAGKNIVVVLPDTGERYLSTAAFSG